MDKPLQIDGLKELRRDLRAMSPQVLPEVRKVLKGAAEVIAADARRRAPKGTRAIPKSRRPQVRLADSIKATTAGANAVVRSRLPYASVQHWGGTTGRGHSAHTIGAIKVKGTFFITRAFEDKQDEARRKLGDGLEALARRHGWH